MSLESENIVLFQSDDAVEPWPWAPSNENEFNAWILSPDHKNRYRVPTDRMNAMVRYLRNPSTPTPTPLLRIIKYRAKYDYELQGNTLYRVKDNRKLYVVPRHETWKLITEAHLVGHTGVDKTYGYCQVRYHGITREEIVWVVSRCSVCKRRRTGAASISDPPMVEDTPIQESDNMSDEEISSPHARFLTPDTIATPVEESAGGSEIPPVNDTQAYAPDVYSPDLSDLFQEINSRYHNSQAHLMKRVAELETHVSQLEEQLVLRDATEKKLKARISELKSMFAEDVFQAILDKKEERMGSLSADVAPAKRARIE